MTDRAAVLWATFFGCGFAPKGPGTAGSAAAILVALAAAMLFAFPPAALLAVAAIATPPSVAAATITARIYRRKDPQIVVVDEVLGQWIALAGATVWNWKSVLAAFALFRLFDIFKPEPVRRFEKLPDGLGIVCDDLMAGAYAALVLLVAGWFNLY